VSRLRLKWLWTSTRREFAVKSDGVDANSCSVRTGEWVGDCFIYTNSTNRLNYLVGDQTYTISHFDSPMYLLGYIPRDGRIYLADKDVGVVSYGLSLSVVEYQTVVLRGDMDAATELLESVPDDQKNKIARFLEGQGYKELALDVATDPEHRFDLALALGNLDVALQLAREVDAEHKWKTVGDAALAAWNLVLAQECFTNAKDIGSLLLLHTASGNVEGLKSLAAMATEAGANNVAFNCLWQTGDVEACVKLLTKTGRHAEAALFAQTYKPSLASAAAKEWKRSLVADKKPKIAQAIAVPEEDEELFPNWPDLADSADLAESAESAESAE
jgi:coatomer subunit beta'